MQKAFTIKEAISFGWRKTIDNLGFFVIFTLCFFAVMALTDVLSGSDKEMGPAKIFDVIGTVVSYFATFAFVRIAIKVYRGGVPEVKDVFEINWKMFGFFILASILYALSTFIGLLLLVIPGIILAIRLGLYPYSLVDENLGFFQSLKRSYAITHGNFWLLVGLSVLVSLINIAGFILLGLGLLVTMPLGFLSMAYAYEKLKAAPVPQAITS